jgi:hypothetical protein
MEQYHPDDMPVEGEPGDDLLEIAEKNEQAAREWLDERTTVLDVENVDTSANEYRTIKSILIMQF